MWHTVISNSLWPAVISNSLRLTVFSNSLLQMVISNSLWHTVISNFLWHTVISNFLWHTVISNFWWHMVIYKFSVAHGHLELRMNLLCCLFQDLTTSQNIEEIRIMFQGCLMIDTTFMRVSNTVICS